MQLDCPGLSLFHDVRGSFSELLRRALHGGRIGVALGPIYEEDPAKDLLLPFYRIDAETGWTKGAEHDGLPPQTLSEARRRRQEIVDTWCPTGELHDSDIEHMDDWARAGLILEVSRRRGINVRKLGKVHVDWRLKGTVTGRFGAKSHPGNPTWPNGFNPLTIPEDKRELVVPSTGGRMVCVIDFRAMDLCSMISLVPGLGRHYKDSTDHHGTTARILFGDDVQQVPEARDVCKIEIFTHAYGGESHLRSLFEERMPELTAVRKIPEGEFARSVQGISATAFRGALSEALPDLLGEDIIPMFTVHDELVLDVGEDQVAGCLDLCGTLERGAKRAIGVDYFAEPKFGLNYAEAKRS